MKNLNFWTQTILRRSCLALFTVALLGGPITGSGLVQGQDFIWNAGGSPVLNGFNNPINWTPFGVPGAGDQVFFSRLFESR